MSLIELQGSWDPIPVVKPIKKTLFWKVKNINKYINKVKIEQRTNEMTKLKKKMKMR